MFYKSEKTNGQTVQPIKIKTVALLVSYHGSLIFKHFCSFYYALGISSPKICSVRSKYFQKSAKTDVSKVSAKAG